VKNLDKRIDDLGDVLKGLKRAVPFGLAEDEEKRRTTTEPEPRTTPTAARARTGNTAAPPSTATTAPTPSP
jgi:hypothetical protein